MPKFSVILPEHNSGLFMRHMLGSIRRQTFTDYELIIACDRCSDNTVKIAREYTDKVLEVDFGRCGLARNAALDIATGDWVIFADDDDWWLHEFAFEILAQSTEELDADVICFGFLARDFVGQKGVNCFWNYPENRLPFYRIWAAPWNKIMRRSFVGDHRFPDWPHSDDFGFAKEMIPLAGDRIAFLDQPLYYYNYMRPGSIQDKLKKGEL